MSQENVEIVERSLEALARRDTAAVLEALDDDFVLRPNSYRVDGIDFHGREGMREWMEGFFETWSTIELSSRVITAQGDHVVAGLTPLLVGQGSGAPVGQEIFYACTLRDRQILQAIAYPSEAEALEAVGLRE